MPNTAPVFLNDDPLLHKQNVGSQRFNSLAAVSDPDSGQTLTWTQASAPAHGTLSVSLATAQAGGTGIEPGGMLVYMANDGYAGVEALHRHRPQVAIVDIGLPGIDGYEVARRARTFARHGECLMVALTGYGAPEQRARALEAGFDVHLVKPVEADQLASLLESGKLAPVASVS